MKGCREIQEERRRGKRPRLSGSPIGCNKACSHVARSPRKARAAGRATRHRGNRTITRASADGGARAEFSPSKHFSD
eukprot:13480-Pyramimonas_sp.AAC.2